MVTIIRGCSNCLQGLITAQERRIAAKLYVGRGSCNHPPSRASQLFTHISASSCTQASEIFLRVLKYFDVNEASE